MSLIHKILGAESKWGTEQKLVLGNVLFNNGTNFPPFLPVVMRELEAKTAEEHGDDTPMSVVSFFPSRNGSNARVSQTIRWRSVILADPKRVLDDRKVLAIDKFDFKRIPDLRQYVMANGAITLTMDDAANGADFVKKLGLFKKIYKYSARLGTNTDECAPNSNDDIIQTAVSIYDLPFTIPIYNTKRVDGIGVHVAMLWKERTERNNKLKNMGEMFFAMSQHRDNLLVVDGAKVHDRGFIGDDYLRHFSGKLQNEAKRQAEHKKALKKANKEGSKPEKKQTKKTRPSGKLSATMRNGYISVDTRSNFYYSGTSSSTTTTY